MHRLTERERHVLNLVEVGMTAKEIAIQLGIAPRTVEKHIEHIRLKFHAKNRAHMIALAVQSNMMIEQTTEQTTA
jgi:LuxR family transcriptional regulator of spore coat protein